MNVSIMGQFRIHAELVRRKVYQTGAAYMLAALAVWGAVDFAAEAFAWPPLALRLVIFCSALGLPVALLAAWIFDARFDPRDADESTGPKPVSVAVAVAVGLSGLVAIVAVWTGIRSEPEAQPRARTATRQVTFTGWGTNPAISPDGQTIAFFTVGPLDSAELVVQRVQGGEPRRIGYGDNRGQSPVWYPDGTEVAVTTSAGWVAFPVNGQGSRLVDDRGATFMTLSPGGDRRAHAWQSSARVEVVRSATGERREIVLHADTEFYIIALAWSPVADLLAVQLVDHQISNVSLWTVKVDGSEQTLVSEWPATSPEIPDLEWSRAGDAIFFQRAEQVWRIGVDPLEGVPRRDDRGLPTGIVSDDFYPMPDGGHVAYTSIVGGSELWLHEIAAGSVLQPGSQLTRYDGLFVQSAKFSPDGDAVAFSSSEGFRAGKPRGAYVITLASRAQRQILAGVAPRMAWSTDGEYLAYVGGDERGVRGYVVSASGGAPTPTGGEDSFARALPTWCSPVEVLFPVRPTADLRLHNVATGESQLYVTDSVTVAQAVDEPVCSPDGSQVVVTWRWFHEGRLTLGLWVFSRGGGAERRLLLEGDWLPLRWSPDGAWIYARNWDGRLARISPAGGAPDLIDNVGEEGVVSDVSRDGSRVLFTKYHSVADIWISPIALDELPGG